MSHGADELARATAPGGTMKGAVSFGVANAWIRVGKYEKALEIYETWLKNASQSQDPESIRVALLNKAGVCVETKAIGDAEKIAEELRSLGQKSPYKQAMYPYLVLQGLIDLEQGDFGKAIDNLNGSSGWFDSEFFGPSNNAAYIYPSPSPIISPGPAKAREEFEKLTNLTAGRWDFGDYYAKSFYWLGKIAEGQKDKARARQDYEKFLDLWKDADPGQPEVDDAKARLAALS